MLAAQADEAAIVEFAKALRMKQKRLMASLCIYVLAPSLTRGACVSCQHVSSHGRTLQFEPVFVLTCAHTQPVRQRTRDIQRCSLAVAQVGVHRAVLAHRLWRPLLVMSQRIILPGGRAYALVARDSCVEVSWETARGVMSRTKHGANSSSMPFHDCLRLCHTTCLSDAPCVTMLS